MSSDDAGWPDDADVIGVVVGDEARAYPISELNAREMVIDVIGDVPVVITWCPACGTAMVHRRTVDGETLLFGVQGGLYRNAMTWWDHDSGSIWSQPLGSAIAGPRRGQTVELLPSQLTTWGAWRQANPETMALDVPAVATPVELDDLLVVVVVDDEVRAFSVNGLRRAVVVNDTVGAVAIAVVSDPANPARWAVFDRRVGDDTTVELEAAGTALRDRVTGSRFDPATGRGLDGPPGRDRPRSPPRRHVPLGVWSDPHPDADHRVARRHRLVVVTARAAASAGRRACRLTSLDFT